MNEFKIIKIKKKEHNLSKKNLYKQILSSSKKVKDIINNKKFNYLNNVVVDNKLVKLNSLDNDPIEKRRQNEIKQKEKILLILEERAEKQKIIEVEKQKRIEKDKILLMLEERAEKQKIIEVEKQKRIEKDKILLMLEERAEKQKIIEVEKQKKIEVEKKKVFFTIQKKKKSFKQNTIKKYFDNSKKSKKKNKLLEIIKLLNKNKNSDNKILIILKRLNKEFIIDILLALNLIKKRSNAPKKLLENILFSYITSNIIITYR